LSHRVETGGGVSRPPLRARLAAVLAAVLCLPAAARAGHELPFYPSFYPQEIKIDSLEPAVAAPLVAKSAVQAYVGGDPFVGRKLPADMATVESLGAFLVVTLNPAAPGFDTAERRCERVRRIVGSLVPGPSWRAARWRSARRESCARPTARGMPRSKRSRSTSCSPRSGPGSTACSALRG
jgi:hypothetical protein